MEAKKIIITGGATRIGSAIAKSLAGYDVDIVIHFNKSKKSALQLKTELEEIGAKVFLIKADLSNINQTKKIVPFAYKKMKGLDCLINNASLFEKDDLENFNEGCLSIPDVRGDVTRPTTIKIKYQNQYFKEIEDLAPYGINFDEKLLISKKAHLILPTHLLLDAASEAAKGKAKIGSTLKGIGPTYMDKTGRNGILL